MKLQNLVLTTNVAGNKILTCNNEDIMDNLKLYLRQGNSQYTVTGVKTGSVYKFTFPALDFGIVRMQFVSTRGTQVRASTIFSTMIEDSVISEPSREFVKTTDLIAVDNKYKVITDNLTESLNTHKTSYATFHDDQLIYNSNTTTDINNYKLATNTSISSINTQLSNIYTKDAVNGLITTSNNNTDTKLLSYYTKTEIDTKLNTLDLSNYVLKTSVYTKTEIDNLFVPYYTTTQINDKLSLYYTKVNVDSLIANDRLTSDGKYVLKTDFDTYKSTVYTKSDIDTKINNINTQITNLTSTVSTLSGTVNTNYTTLDDKIDNLSLDVDIYNNTQTTNLNSYKTTANNKITTLESDVTTIKNDYVKTADLSTLTYSKTLADSTFVKATNYNAYKTSNDNAISAISYNLNTNYYNKTDTDTAINNKTSPIVTNLTNNYDTSSTVTNKINTAIANTASAANTYTKAEINAFTVKYNTTSSTASKYVLDLDLESPNITSNTIIATDSELTNSTIQVGKVISLSTGNTSSGMNSTSTSTDFKNQTVNIGTASTSGILDFPNTGSTSKALFTNLTGTGQFKLPYTQTIKHSAVSYNTKAEIEDRSFIFSYNDKGGADTTQEAGFYTGFNTVDTPVTNGWQIAGLGLYTYSTTNAYDHGLAFYTYYRQDKTSNYNRTKKTIVTSGNSTIDGATWNLTSSLWFSGTGSIYMTPDADIFIQPTNGKTLSMGTGITVNGGILKINPQYGRGLLLPRYDTTDLTLKRTNINYSFGWSGTTTQWDKFAFFRNKNKQEFMHTVMSIGDNNQYGDSSYNKEDTEVGTNAGFTILSDNSEKKISIGQITRTSGSARIDWMDLLSSNDMYIDETSTPKSGVKYYPNNCVEIWFHLTEDNAKIVWKTDEELAADALAIANGTATEYNRHQYKTAYIQIGENYYRMLLHVTCPIMINKIYDIKIESTSYTSIMLASNEELLTPDGKLILIYGNGYLPNKPALNDPNYQSAMATYTNNYNAMYSTMGEILTTKVRILAKKL